MPVSHAGPPADCSSHPSLFPGLCFLKEWLCVPCQKDQKVKKDLTIGTVERRTLMQPRRVESISCHPFSSGHALSRWRLDSGSRLAVSSVTVLKCSVHNIYT